MPAEVLINIHDNIIPCFDNVVACRELDVLVAAFRGWSRFEADGNWIKGYPPDNRLCFKFSVPQFSNASYPALQIWKEIPLKWDGQKAYWTLHYDAQEDCWTALMALNGYTPLTMGKGSLPLAICVAYCKAKLREQGG